MSYDQIIIKVRNTYRDISAATVEMLINDSDWLGQKGMYKQESRTDLESESKCEFPHWYNNVKCI